MGHLENLVSQDGCPLQHNRGKLEFFTEVCVYVCACVCEGTMRCNAGNFEMRALPPPPYDAIGCNLHSFSARCYWMLLRSPCKLILLSLSLSLFHPAWTEFRFFHFQARCNANLNRARKREREKRGYGGNFNWNEIFRDWQFWNDRYILASFRGISRLTFIFHFRGVRRYKFNLEINNLTPIFGEFVSVGSNRKWLTRLFVFKLCVY